MRTYLALLTVAILTTPSALVGALIWLHIVTA